MFIKNARSESLGHFLFQSFQDELDILEVKTDAVGVIV